MGYQTMRFFANLTGVSEKGFYTVSVSAYLSAEAVFIFSMELSPEPLYSSYQLLFLRRILYGWQGSISGSSRFTGRNVPVSVVAKVMGKGKQFVRQGMIHGNLPIGSVFKKEGSIQYDYYVSPKLLWEFTGFIYRGETEKDFE